MILGGTCRPSGKRVTSGTNLLTSIITSGDGKIQAREFFDYDHNNVLIQKIIDDAKSSDRNSLTGATFRKIYRSKPRTTTAFNLPEEEEVFYVDLNTEQELLLYREVNSYTQAGKLVKKERYDSHNNYAYSLHWEYDQQGNLIEEIDALGRRISRGYDRNKNCIFEQGPALDSHREHLYDFANRLVLTQEVHPDGALCTSYHYNGLSQLVRKIDPFGQETHYQYDEFGRLISTKLPQLASPSGELITLIINNTYNSLGQPTSTTDANGFTIRYQPTVLGKPSTIYYPDGSTNKFEYDIYGRQITAIAKNGSVTKRIYDCLGRTLEETVLSPNGKQVMPTTKQAFSLALQLTVCKTPSHMMPFTS